MSGSGAPLAGPVFLVGFMGSGKSEAGKSLAAMLGWKFEDTDQMVEAAEGRSIEEIFRASGEGRFREAEWRVLETFAGRTGIVVATGGGLFLGVVQRAFLKANGVTVWLDAPLERIRRRLGDSKGRPLWARNDAVAQRMFFEKRRAAYALADVRVDAGEGSPDDVARRVLACLMRLRR